MANEDIKTWINRFRTGFEGLSSDIRDNSEYVGGA